MIEATECPALNGYPDFVVPNGLAFSPDERILYINDSRRGHIRAFDVEESGLLAMATDRIFATLQDDRIGVPDGMKVDVKGNLYTTHGKVKIYNPDGKLLEEITVPEGPANVCFGGDDYKTLFITARTSLYSIRMVNAGAKPPGAKW